MQLLRTNQLLLMFVQLLSCPNIKIMGNRRPRLWFLSEVVEDDAEGSVFPDVILIEEEEDELSYRTAVKYGGMEHLMQLF